MDTRKKKIAWLLACAAVLCMLLMGCKTQEDIDRQMQQAIQNASKSSSQEIVIKQELAREERLLNVTGTGKVDAEPDLASVMLSVYVVAETAEEAQASNSALMAEVLAAIKAMGITDQNIKTQEISVFPLHDNTKAVTEVTGYSATNTITVKLHNVKRTGDLVTAAMQAGASEVLQIEFQLLDETAAYQQALSEAVEDANNKAAIMAEKAGVELRGPMLIVEDIEVMQNMADVLLYESAITNAQTQGDGTVTSTPVQAGQITVTAQVRIDYSLLWPATPTPSP